MAKGFKNFLKAESDRTKEKIRNARWFYVGDVEDFTDIDKWDVRSNSVLLYHENFFKKGHESIIGTYDKFLQAQIIKSGGKEIKPGSSLYHYIDPKNLIDKFK